MECTSYGTSAKCLLRYYAWRRVSYFDTTLDVYKRQDMETSAIMSIGNYRHLQTAAILMVSDVHSHETEHCAWEWKVTDAMREAFTRTCISCVQRLSSDKEITK